MNGKCGNGWCGDTNRRCRDTGCCTYGGCFIRCPTRNSCCPMNLPLSPVNCPPPPPRYNLPPVILPLNCHKSTCENCAQEFIITAIQTACRSPPPICCDAPCGPKATIINFLAPNFPLPKRPQNLCPLNSGR